MTREELELGMLGMFDKYEVLFRHIEFTRMDFLAWLNSFTTYDEIRKASQFMMVRFLKQLLVVHRVWSHHSVKDWNILFLISEDSIDVKLIKGHFRDLKNLWSRRPKAKRRPI